MADESDLFRAKVGVSMEGATAELAVGKKLPGKLAKLFPQRTARSELILAINDQVVSKIQNGSPLSPADIQFLKDIAGDAAAKWARKQQVATRALKAYEEKRLLQLEPLHDDPSGCASEPTGPSRETDEDWTSRFWEDASLVSNEMLQELYGRVLASEAFAPGSCSTRTLRVLRYLDRATAEKFGQAMKWVFSDSFVFEFPDNGIPPGLEYNLFLDLEDAGILKSTALTNIPTTDDYLATYGTLAIRIENAKGISFDAYPLTAAGIDLAGIAQVERVRDNFFWSARNLCLHNPDIRMSWAERPDTSWDGNNDGLVWHAITNATIGKPPFHSLAF